MAKRPAVPMEWSDFVKRISGIDRALDHVVDPDDAWLKQEAIQQLVMSLSQAYHGIMSDDPDHPAFFSFLNPVIKSAAPNPDYMYRNAFIEGTGRYRISGWRGTSLFVHLAIGTGFIGVDDTPGPAVGNIDLDELTLGEDGAFSVLLSAERPAGYVGDWVRLDPRARSVGVREASYDWVGEVDCRIAIERLDGAVTYRRWPMQEIAHRLERLAGFPERYAELFVGFVKKMADHPVNTVVLNDWSHMGGLAEQTYYEGMFEFAPGECLVIDTDVPSEVRYWQVLLADQLFNTIDWDKCQSSLNGFQAELASDGRFHAVICDVDPGVPNWLDPAGRYKGVVQGRWYRANAAPCPQVTRMPLADLRRHLPADTPVIDADERRRRLLHRFRGAQFRRKW